MGLDITAYQGLKKVDNPLLDSDGYPENYDTETKFGVNPHYTERMEGVDPDAVYQYEDSFGFRAGSYGGYNAWREELAKLAGYAPVSVDEYSIGKPRLRHDHGAWNQTEGPFWELIHFSDCEGVIGPVVATKLAKEFAEWDERAKTHSATIDRGDWFYPLYREWRKAFEMAAQNGAVDFH